MIQWLAAVALVVSLPAVAAPSDTDTTNATAQAMAQAIARMMESMGFRNGGSNGARDYGSAGTGWPSAFGPWSGLPGALPMSPSLGGYGSRLGWGSTVLDGVWEDNQGGLLIVQDNRYRIYSPCQGNVDGGIRIEAGRMELTNWSENITQIFELALDQDRLALRGSDGQLFVYRRLILSR